MASTGNSVTLLRMVKDSVALEKTCVEWVERREVVERHFGEDFSRTAYFLHVRPHKIWQCRCQKCMKRCVRDGFRHEEESVWRAPDLNGIPVFLCYRPQRVKCDECGELNEWIPWADGESRFTVEFNDEVAWLTCRMSKTDITLYLRINWRTVGNCLKRAHERIEPDVTDRVHDGLEEICVDLVLSGPPVHHRRLRHEEEQGRLGPQGPRQVRLRGVLPAPDARGEGEHKGGGRRRGQVDRRLREGALPQRQALCRFLPRLMETFP